MRERAVRIGSPTPLISIICEPEEIDTAKPAVIILNSGVMHHIGTCRLSVKIARNLANLGILSCRFDFSGIGDSETRRGNLAFEESGPLEIKEVMDYLSKKRGITRFVLYGLCSGADASYETAKIDERVVGIIQIDPYCYRTWKWYFVYYGPRVLKFDVWRRFFDRTFGKSKKGAGDDIDEEFIELPSYIRVFPPYASVRSGLESLVERNVRIYDIFTGGQDDILNYENQFQESFRAINFGNLLKTDYLLDATHIITEPHYQSFVVNEVGQWVLELSDQLLPTE